MTLGEKLKRLRTEAQLTQDELAARLFVTRTAISKWEADRGYPNLDSLKAIAKFFSVTVDELLSSGEVMRIAEEDGREKKRRLRDGAFALLDMSAALLLLLPVFAERAEGGAQSVSLLALSGVQPWLKAACIVLVVGMLLWGALGLAPLGDRWALFSKIKTNASLSLGACAVVLFALSLHPYATVLAFVLLAFKVLALIKCR